MKYLISVILIITLCGCIRYSATEQLNYLQKKYPEAKVFLVPDDEYHQEYILTYPCGKVIYVNISVSNLKTSQVELSPCLNTL